MSRDRETFSRRVRVRSFEHCIVESLKLDVDARKYSRLDYDYIERTEMVVLLFSARERNTKRLG